MENIARMLGKFIGEAMNKSKYGSGLDEPTTSARINMIEKLSSDRLSERWEFCLPLHLVRAALLFIIVVGVIGSAGAQNQTTTTDVPNTAPIRGWCGLPNKVIHEQWTVGHTPTSSHASTVHAQSDEVAVNLLRTLSADGNRQILLMGSEISGSLQIAGAHQKFPIRFWTKANAFRVETDLPRGTSVITSDGRTASANDPSGKVKAISRLGGSGRQAEHLPMLTVARALNSPSAVIWLAEAKDDLQAIAISETGSDPASQNEYPTCLIYSKSQQSIVAIDTAETAQNYPDHVHPMSTVYSKYERVKGIEVPRRQDVYLDGILRYTVYLEKIDFGHARDKRDFTQSEDSNVR